MAESLTSIGFTRKTYGLQGHLKVRIEDRYLEDFFQAEIVFVRQKGHPLPFFVEEFAEKGDLLVKFEDVDTKEAAQALTSCEMFLRDADLMPEEERSPIPSDLEYDKYTGYQLSDQQLGMIGTIEEVVEYPQQEMAVLQYQGKPILIPLNSQLIQRIDAEAKVLHMELPEGLLDIF
ncbi:MAG: ribosome maturation factor RimM [Bacteroidota bacterium]